MRRGRRGRRGAGRDRFRRASAGLHLEQLLVEHELGPPGNRKRRPSPGRDVTTTLGNLCQSWLNKKAYIK